MPVTQAYECDICGNLYRDALTITVESDKALLTYGQSTSQSRIVIVCCYKCISLVGEVIKGALHH